MKHIGIIGAGIAGFTLAYRLQQRGFKVTIFDKKEQASSSAVAGGMFNPVTGKHLSKTWKLAELYPELYSFYTQLEKEFNRSFFHPCGVIRIVKNENQKHQFNTRIKTLEIEDFVKFIPKIPLESLKDKEGLLISKSGWVNVPELLKGFHELFKTQIINENFEHSKLELDQDTVNYKEHTFNQLVFCEGYYANFNPYFNYLPFNLAKGETLLFTSKEEFPSEIINNGKWIINMGENQYRVGSTYEWDKLDFEPTTEARTALESFIKEGIFKDYSIKQQEAGIRPTTDDRRPFCGVHPKEKTLFIFNGLGTKGVSLAPYLAQEMASFIEFKKELDPELNIERYNALYLKQE